MSASDMAKLTFKENEGNSVRLVEYANFLLKDDAAVKDLLPTPPTAQNFAKNCSNGVLLAKILLLTKPGLFDLGKLNVAPKQGFQINANQALCIDAIKDIGFKGYEKLIPDSFNEPDVTIMMEILEKCIKKLTFDNFSSKTLPDLVTVAPFAKHEAKVEEKKEEGPMAKVKIAKKENPELLMVRYVNQQLRTQRLYTPITTLSEMTPKHWVLMTKSMDPIKIKTDVAKLADNNAMAEAAEENLKTLNIAHFVTKQEILDANANMFQYFFAITIPKMPLFHPYFETHGRELAEVADERDQRIRMWNEENHKIEITTSVMDTWKDNVSMAYFIEDAIGEKMDWSKVAKGKLNNFKAIDNWKYFMACANSLTRFPPSIEVASLTGATEPDKVNVIMDLLYEGYRDRVISKLPKKEELLAWANPLVVSSGKHAAVNSLAEVGPAYLAALLVSIDPKSDMFFDANKVADSLDCAKEVVTKSWKLGIFLNTTPAKLAAKDEKAAHIALAEMKKVFPY